MSTGRVLWIIWCLMWTAFWFLTGLVTIVGIFLFWPLAGLSALAILIPVGKAAAPVVSVSTCPVCGAAGDPAFLPMHIQTTHGYGPPTIGGGPVPTGPVIVEQPRGYGPPVQPYYAARPPMLPPGTRPLPPPPGPPPPLG
jgi:hypothetical protein